MKNILYIEITTYANIQNCTIDPGKKFSVPFEWLEAFVIDEFDWTVEEFLNEYTWDNSETVLEKAKKDGVIKITNEKTNSNEFDPKTQVAIIWSVEDVKGQRRDLNDEQCMEVLKALKVNHDANYGVCWDTIDQQIETLYPIK
ncbi:hypothetical protein [Clostridium estertheticum]|uniref:hypothetical protein n=1 Tax=Clostridium estertheticum TaxID=238834 RepID=UPI001C0ABA12|nr:hypothetical protein [Clostridium estertheticum]MBU3173309.1 hypothetical protein [Clostridium estertheticum]